MSTAPAAYRPVLRSTSQPPCTGLAESEACRYPQEISHSRWGLTVRIPASFASTAGRWTACALAASMLTACGGGGGGGGGGPPPPTTYTIGGTITGLSASGLTLDDNGGDTLTVSSGASTFTFATKVQSGGAYAVTVASQPTGETCTVSAGSGTASANVTSVAVACVANTYTISGTITGL